MPKKRYEIINFPPVHQL